MYIDCHAQYLNIYFFVLQEADENGSDGLDIDEFRTAFGQILGKGKNDQQVLQVIAVIVHDI